MPRRKGWFLVIERDGNMAAQPVNNRREVCMWLSTLAPVIPLDAWVSVRRPPSTWRRDSRSRRANGAGLEGSNL